MRDGVVRVLTILSLAGLLLTVVSAQVTSGDPWSQTEARLTALLAGSSEQKRSALADIRNIRTEEASRLAVPALSDKVEIVRATAASSVISLPDDEAARVLLPMLDDKQPFVRREAAYALGKVGNGAATSRLRRTLTGDRDLEVRVAAAIAIGSIGDRSAMDDLLSILNRRPKEEEEFLRRSAARSIGQIFELRATGRTETTPQNFLPPQFKNIDPETIWSSEIDPQQLRRITVTLSKMLRSREEADDTRREAAFALGALRRPGSESLLRSLLNSPDPYLAEISKEALLKFR